MGSFTRKGQVFSQGDTSMYTQSTHAQLFEQFGNFLGQISFGVIGGTGLYEIPGAEVRAIIPAELFQTSLFGQPAGPITIVEVADKQIAFLPRHGIGHIYAPHNVPYAANALALKALVKRETGMSVVIVSACGSLQGTKPGTFVLPDGFFDFTRGRQSTFFDQVSLVGHVPLGAGICFEVRSQIAQALQTIPGEKILFEADPDLIYGTIQGPQYSFRSESQTFRRWNWHIIGMTTSTELKFLRECSDIHTPIRPAVIALVTDEDNPEDAQQEGVHAELVEAVFKANVGNVFRLLPHAFEHTISGEQCSCDGCSTSVGKSVHTNGEYISGELQGVYTFLTT